MYLSLVSKIEIMKKFIKVLQMSFPIFKFVKIVKDIPYYTLSFFQDFKLIWNDFENECEGLEDARH